MNNRYNLNLRQNSWQFNLPTNMKWILTFRHLNKKRSFLFYNSKMLLQRLNFKQKSTVLRDLNSNKFRM